MSGDIRVELELDSDDFERGVIRANSTLADLERRAGGTVVAINRMTEGSRDFLSVMRDFTVIAATAGAALENINKVTTGVVGKIVSMNAEVERLTTLLKSLSTAADPVGEATKQLSDLREQAKNAPFSIEAMHQAFVRLKTGGIDPTKGALKGLMDAVAATGGTDAQLARASLAIQEMGAKGVVQLKELRIQLAQAVPGAVQVMARAVGVGYQQLMSDIHTGTVDAGKMLEAYARENERTFGGAAQRQMQTYNGQLKRTQSVLFDLSVAVGGLNKDGSQSQTGFFGQIKNSMVEMNDALDSGFAHRLADDLGKGLSQVATWLHQGVETAVDFRHEIVAVAEAFGAGILLKGAGMFIASVKNMASEGRVAFALIGTEYSLMTRRLNQTSMGAGLVSIFAGMRREAIGLAGDITGPVTRALIALRAEIASNAANMAALKAGALAGSQMGAMYGASRIQPGQWFSSTSSAAMNKVMVSAGSGITTLERVSGVADLALRGLAGGFSMVAGAARVFGAVLPFIATGLEIVAPWLPLIIGGVALLGETFGWFKNPAKDAADELERFGASSVKQVEAARTYGDELRRNLQTLKESQKLTGDAALGAGSNEDIEAAQKKLDAFNAQLPEWQKQGIEGDAEKLSAAKRKALSDDEAAIQREYIKTANTQYEAYHEAYEKTTKDRQTTYFIDEKYGADRKAAALKYYDDQIALFSRMYDQQAALAASGDAVVSASAKKMQVEVGQSLANIRQQRLDTQNQVMGVTKGDKAFDMAKFMRDGENEADKFESQIAGFAAGLQGLDPLVTQINESLRLKSLGSDAIPEVEKLIQRITRAKEEADELKKAFEGQEKLDRDEASLREKLEDENFKAHYGRMSEVDQLRIKIQNGHYAGFGNPQDEAAQKVVELRKHMEDLGRQAAANQKLMNDAVGQGMAIGVDKLNESLGRTQGLLTGIGRAAPNLATAMAASGQGRMSPFGTLAGAGDGFISRLVGSESSGNPNAQASTSSAMGLTQFTTGTWDEFLKARHPELLSNPNRADYRADPQMSMEGAGWYAQQNAGALSKGGIDPTDANLMLAHLLGPGGATAALSKSDDTSLSAIPELAKALNSNAFMRSFSVGDLQSFAQSKMGTGSSFMKGDSRLVDPDNVRTKDHDELRSDDALVHDTNVTTIANKISQAADDMHKLAARAGERQDGKNISKVDSDIKAGDYDPSNLDPKSPAYARLRKEAMGADKEQGDEQDREKSAKEADSATDELAKGAKEAAAKLKAAFDALARGPNAPKVPAEVAEQKVKNDERLEKVGNEHGTDSSEYADARKQSQSQIDAMSDEAIVKDVEGFAKKTQALRESLMSQDQLQADQFAKEKERLAQDLANFKGTEKQKQALMKKVSDYESADAAKRAQATPLGSELKGYTDIGKNLNQNAASLTGSAIDNLTNMIDGQKVKWRSFMQSITKDLTKSVLQFGVGSIGGGLKGGAGGNPLGSLFGKGTPATPAAGGAGGLAKLGGGLGAVGSAAGSAVSGVGSFLGGLFHTGGIIGNTTSMYRSTSLDAFVGAPRFHTGGVIGSDEVPIIAQRGEGVFTKAQMEAIGGGGGGSVSINMGDTHVHANGGDAKQNADLADQVQKQMKDMVRKEIVGQLSQQMRPGNMLQNVVK